MFEIVNFNSKTTLKIKLNRITGGKALRTTEIIGTVNKLPEKGEQLVLIGDPLEKGFWSRLVTTSPVVYYEDIEAGRLITTRSGSKYFIEVLKELK